MCSREKVKITILQVDRFWAMPVEAIPVNDAFLGDRWFTQDILKEIVSSLHQDVQLASQQCSNGGLKDDQPKTLTTSNVLLEYRFRKDSHPYNSVLKRYPGSALPHGFKMLPVKLVVHAVYRRPQSTSNLSFQLLTAVSNLPVISEYFKGGIGAQQCEDDEDVEKVKLQAFPSKRRNILAKKKKIKGLNIKRTYVNEGDSVKSNDAKLTGDSVENNCALVFKDNCTIAQARLCESTAGSSEENTCVGRPDYHSVGSHLSGYDTADLSDKNCVGRLDKKDVESHLSDGETADWCVNNPAIEAVGNLELHQKSDSLGNVCGTRAVRNVVKTRPDDCEKNKPIQEDCESSGKSCVSDGDKTHCDHQFKPAFEKQELNCDLRTREQIGTEDDEDKENRVTHDHLVACSQLMNYDHVLNTGCDDYHFDELSNQADFSQSYFGDQLHGAETNQSYNHSGEYPAFDSDRFDLRMTDSGTADSSGLDDLPEVNLRTRKRSRPEISKKRTKQKHSTLSTVRKARQSSTSVFKKLKTANVKGRSGKEDRSCVVQPCIKTGITADSTDRILGVDSSCLSDSDGLTCGAASQIDGARSSSTSRGKNSSIGNERLSDAQRTQSFEQRMVVENQNGTEQDLASYIGNMSEAYLDKLLDKNMSYLKGIFHGKIECTRHESYKKGGCLRNNLMYQVRLGLYTEDHLDTIMNSLMNIFCKQHTKYLDYVTKVLLPEAAIKIVMDFQGASHEEAEEVLRSCERE